MASTEPADVHTLVGAYALDALDDDERADVERHLADCESCREEVAGLRRTVVRLADAAAVPPPRRVRDAVLAQVAATPQVRGGLRRQARDDARRLAPAAPQRRPVWLAAAAVLATVSAGTGAAAWTEYRAAQDARTAAERITGVVADPGARQVQAGVTGGGRARLVVAGDRAVLAGGGLAALPGDRTYQVWVIRGTRISSAGLGPRGADAAAPWTRLVSGVRPGDTVAVSVEPSGGSAQPTTTPIVALKV